MIERTLGNKLLELSSYYPTVVVTVHDSPARPPCVG